MNTITNTNTNTTNTNTAIQLYYIRNYFGGCVVKTPAELGRLKMSKAAYAAGLKALEENDLGFVYNDESCSLRAEKVPVIVKPDDTDYGTVIKVLREGVYYPGMVGDPTHWWEIEIVYDGEVVKCFRADMSGYDSDETWLELECSDLEEVEWYDEDEDEEEDEYDYKWITSPRELDFRHVSDVLKELKEKGSVTIR